VERLAEMMAEFEVLRERQWNKGAEEYGPDAFVGLTNDQMLDMYLEELADIANYAMMTSIRLRLWKEKVESSSDKSIQPDARDAQYEFPPSSGTFVRTQDIPGFLPNGAGLQDS